MWRFQNYRDCGYTCNPHKFEIPALRFPCKVPVIPCKHLQCRVSVRWTQNLYYETGIFSPKTVTEQEADYLECFLIPHHTFTYYRVSFSNLYVLMYMGISKHALYITDHSWSKRKFWNNLDERSDTLFSLWECNRVIKRFSHSFCNKFRCLNRNMGEKLF